MAEQKSGSKQQSLERRVLEVLKRQKQQPIGLKKLAVDAKVNAKERSEFSGLIDRMRQDGSLYQKKLSVTLSKNIGLIRGEVVSVTRSFGFVRPQMWEGKPVAELSREEARALDIFIPGKMMQGAMPGDVVLVKPSAGSRGSSPEGVIVSVLTQNNQEFTGVVLQEEGRLLVLPDKNIRVPLAVLEGGIHGAQPGDKVLARVAVRGESHFRHQVEVVTSFGSAQYAKGCCQAVLEAASVRQSFPEEVEAAAQKIAQAGIPPRELEGRMDLTGMDIFTIDSADSKDLDDAVSLERQGDRWLLGVHIADVSHYVRQDSPIDQEAYARGTSIYYADQVIPMLPRALSNGICSLNPDEVRLTFSALLTLDARGELIGYRFVKSYIRSRVKGVYKEVNAILDGSAGEDIRQKYAQLIPQLELMQQLAALLTRKRRQRGAMDLSSSEAKFVIQDGRVTDILPRTGGVSEEIIEEFMLTANQAAASLAMNQQLPFVYRVHDAPPTGKVEALHSLLTLYGVDASRLTSQPEPKVLSDILESVRGTAHEQMVNNQLLRTMAKAVYSHQNLGHYGLVLENYSHFTSPIRRYPDLIIHRILSAFVAGAGEQKLQKRFGSYVPEAAKHCSDREILAMNVERDCEDCYKAEYISRFLGQSFDGVISSVTAFGLYVELPNTVEGLIHLRNLPEGEYQLTESMELVEQRSNTRYHIGQPVRITVLAADVSAGQIDFILEGTPLPASRSPEGERHVSRVSPQKRENAKPRGKREGKAPARHKKRRR